MYGMADDNDIATAMTPREDLINPVNPDYRTGIERMHPVAIERVDPNFPPRDMAYSTPFVPTGLTAPLLGGPYYKGPAEAAAPLSDLTASSAVRTIATIGVLFLAGVGAWSLYKRRH